MVQWHDFMRRYSCTCTWICRPPSLPVYRIAGNFWGRKLSRILWVESHQRTFSPHSFGCGAPTFTVGFSTPWKISPRNAHFLQIRESFLPRKFPAIQYTIIQWFGRYVMQTSADRAGVCSFQLAIMKVMTGQWYSRCLSLYSQAMSVYKLDHFRGKRLGVD